MVILTFDKTVKYFFRIAVGFGLSPCFLQGLYYYKKYELYNIIEKSYNIHRLLRLYL
jgi:hypothetical protein